MARPFVESEAYAVLSAIGERLKAQNAAELQKARDEIRQDKTLPFNEEDFDALIERFKKAVHRSFS